MEELGVCVRQAAGQKGRNVEAGVAQGSVQQILQDLDRIQLRKLRHDFLEVLCLVKGACKQQKSLLFSLFHF